MSTVAAISTPLNPAGLGVLRLSGDEAITIAAKVFRPVGAKTVGAMAGYTAAYGHVFDSEGDIDECVLTVFRAPHSYTGEDVAEFSCHGGTYLLQRTLRALFAAGAHPAEAGEFTRRAFLNGKMDLTQAESVMALIAAQGQLAARCALGVRDGATFRRLEGVTQALLGLQAQFSAYVDCPYDDIPDLQEDVLRTTLHGALTTVQGLLSTYDAGRVLREGVDTAIVGCPNVGKSTLMNALAGFDRSIVTDIPGTTRDVVEESVMLGDVLLRLSDTAGIRTTDDAVEAIGVQRADRRMQTAALLLCVFDGSRPLSDDDRALAERAAQHPCVIALLNKADRPQACDAADLSAYFSAVLPVSAATGQGLDALRAEIARLTGVAALDASEPLLMNERQRLAAVRAAEGIAQALEALDLGMTHDAVSVCIDDACAAVLELTGQRATEAVVDEVFARFCVGK